ncbi:MAG: DUF5658 family protein [Dehalococcoidales bacterium]|nr:DUF5658 family protein [Dehalococcoidales bacterium]
MTFPKLTHSYGRMSIARYLWTSQPDSRDLLLKISYLGLQVLDLGLTLLAMSLGSYELNPVMRASLASPVQLVVMKGGIPLLLAWLLPGKFLIPGIVFLLFVIGWNVKELFLLLF